MGEAEILIFIILISIAIFVFFLVIVALLLQYRKRKAIYENEKKITTELHKAELLNVRMEVQDEFMQQIGREIHDSIAQKLTLASLHLQHTEYENKFSELNQMLIQSSSLINESLDELRFLSHRLLKHSDEQTDIVSTLQTESRLIEQLKLCPIHFNSDSISAMLDTDVALTVLRILQELLQNSLKHASCKNIRVTVKNKQTPFTLIVEDDGKGFLPTQAETSTGTGLKNIKKRALIIGALLQQQSAPGKGTVTSLTLDYTRI